MAQIDNKLITAEELKWVNDKIVDEYYLLGDDVPNTTQTYTFVDGSVSQVLHKNGNDTIRTDTFTYGTETITESRVLYTGASLTIVTNLETLVTTVTFTAA